MAKKSLDEAVKDFTVINMTIHQEGLETHICLNKKNKSTSISAQGITLDYNERKFIENPEQYINEQLKAHKKYYQLLRENLFDAYEGLNKKLEVKNDMERAFDFFPENTSKPTIALCKIINAPASWIKFKTLKSEFRDKVKVYGIGVMGYKTIKIVIDCGYEILKKQLEKSNETISEEDKNKLKECISISEKLKDLYSRLIDTTEKEVKVAKKMYYLFYPKENPESSSD